ncbi:GFA family protein [Pseudomonas sp. RIT-PI-AD]|uniref:GFA family protein n=1 Tax=Pseudomonas sp. RIT-PI-AD TaxID=3035294 RepID=UPI0021D86C02|nr:GFA family protein [Pseudomonas sp. RIT-PI-AD]
MNVETSSALGGRCLCGAVNFSATPLSLTMSACHCAMCRRWAGGVGMAVACAPALRIDDSSALGIYRSSGWGERGFCKACGSSLFWRARDGSALVVSAMAFEDPAQFELKTEIFVDEQPCNYAFAQPTRRLTGAEALAAFSKPNPS